MTTSALSTSLTRYKSISPTEPFPVQPLAHPPTRLLICSPTRHLIFSLISFPTFSPTWSSTCSPTGDALMVGYTTHLMCSLMMIFSCPRSVPFFYPRHRLLYMYIILYRFMNIAKVDRPSIA